MERLLERGSDLGLKDAEGNTAFHYACYEQKDEIAVRLAQAGADYKAENNEGKNPLEVGPFDLSVKLYTLKHGHPPQP